MRVLVCGSRHFNNAEFMAEKLRELANEITVLIHGNARGADILSEFVLQEMRGGELLVFRFFAEWKSHGRSAGPIRNQKMLDKGKPDIVIAFPLPGSVGTYDMINRAVKANVPTLVHKEI